MNFALGGYFDFSADAPIAVGSDTSTAASITGTERLRSPVSAGGLHHSHAAAIGSDRPGRNSSQDALQRHAAATTGLAVVAYGPAIAAIAA